MGKREKNTKKIIWRRMCHFKKGGILLVLFLIAILLSSCDTISTTENTTIKAVTATTATTETIETTKKETTATTKKETTATTEEALLKFSNYKKISGINRIVEPLCAEFIDIKIEKGELYLNDSEIKITGYLKGNENINNTLFPDKGLMAKLEAFIFEGENIVWQQEGYLSGDTWIKNNSESQEFLLINEGETGNKLIIIAYVEGGMFEDDEMSDRGIFAVYEEDGFNVTLTDNRELVQFVKGVLEETYEETAEIEVDEEGEIFRIISKDPDFVGDVLAAKEGNSAALEAWEILVEAMLTMSESVAEWLPNYSVSVINPVNKDLTLLSVWNGVVLYDFIEE